MKKALAIIFDLDGTLLNTDLLIQKTFEHVFEKYKPGYTLSKEEHLSFLGPTLTATFERYFPENMIEELIEYYREYNHAHHEDYVTIYPTVKETLESLKKDNYPLAVVTTKSTHAAYLGLELFDITKYFDIVLGMEDVKNVKPDPEGIKKAMETMKRSNAIYVGDNQTDIQAGKNAEIYTAGVKWSPKGTSAMESLHPDFMIDRMDDILKLIERID